MSTEDQSKYYRLFIKNIPNIWNEWDLLKAFAHHTPVMNIILPEQLDQRVAGLFLYGFLDVRSKREGDRLIALFEKSSANEHNLILTPAGERRQKGGPLSKKPPAPKEFNADEVKRRPFSDLSNLSMVEMDKSTLAAAEESAKKFGKIGRSHFVLIGRQMKSRPLDADMELLLRNLTLLVVKKD